MKIGEVMTSQVEYIEPSTTLMEAAKKMRDLECGFLPVSDENKQKLQGVVTDRDITIRAVADGMDPATTRVDSIITDKVLYCYAEDDIEKAAESMRDQRVYRLIVLNNPDEKKLCGILSLGDLQRHELQDVANRTAKKIAESA
jgi:CBS domain-containing protein